jgi:prevent-host-death family protein
MIAPIVNRIIRSRGMASLSVSILIDIAAMPDTDNQNDQLFISRRVIDTVIPRPRLFNYPNIRIPGTCTSSKAAGADMIQVTTSKARQEFARVLRKVKSGKRFLLERHNKGVAAIVSVEDLAMLEAIENRHDLEEARRALVEVAEKGAIPWEQVRAELGFEGVRTKDQAPDS